MPPIQGYQATVNALKEQLNEARAALSQDVANAVSTKRWDGFLRDRHDVVALVEQIDALSEQPDFVSKLHVMADKNRNQLRGRGRPSNAAKASTKVQPPSNLSDSAMEK